MRILIVLANYNGESLLRKHLPSVLNTEYSNFDVLVVDNNSTDESVSFLKKEYPDVLVLENKENIGFGRANNAGAFEHPGYDGYVFLNTDMDVEKNWLTELVNVYETETNVGAIGCKILYAKKRNGKYIVNSAGMEVDKHFMAYDRYEGEENSKQFDIVEDVEGLSGGAILIPKEAWEDIGGFNSNMFLYYEDVDLSLRLRDFGYNLYYCGLSIVYHDHMGSAGSMGSFRRNFMNMKNRHISVVSRMGFLIGFTETLWYICNWFIWKLLYSNRYSLREHLSKR